MFSTIAAIAAKIASGAIVAIKAIIAGAKTVGAVLAIPTKVAVSIATKAGASAATIAKVEAASKLATAAAISMTTEKITDKMPNVVKPITNLVGDIAIANMALK